MQKKKSLGIYIHIPFCKSRCIYCDFTSCVGGEREMDEYCRYLVKETELAKKQYGDSYFADTVYFGGGTPSLLSEKNFLAVADSVKQAFGENPREFSVEVNPCTANESKFDAFAQAGVTRVSIGVQSFDDKLLKMLGRAHDRECAIGAIKLAKRYGFEVSVDCMTGLPYQTEEDVKEFVRIADSLEVDHISVYMLTVEEGTRLEKLIADKVLTAKTDDEVVALYDAACSALKEAGFDRYEISNFARNGKVSFHNLRYWRMQDYLGLGLSAHSLIGDTRTFNPDTFAEYYGSLDKNVLPCLTEEILDTEEKKEEYVMLAMRLKEGLSISEYDQLFDGDFVKEYAYALVKDACYLKREGDRVAIKEEYFAVMNSIIVDFLK